MSGSGFEAWFNDATGNQPYPWQARIAAADTCEDRLIRIPTGFGKTAGTVLAWLFHRVVCADISWPTRLVFCLPMRTLVEQTEGAIKGWLQQARVAEPAAVHILMGGSDAGSWRLKPESPAILVGTQDMLLSRALNRGYGTGRAAWPMEFGLLHHDVLWVSDEIQLQDVGLATSAQLAAFRVQDDGKRGGALRPSRTWWMSATLQPRWLETVDHASRVPDLAARMERIPAAERTGGLWVVRKTLRRESSCDGQAKPVEIAKLARERHAAGSLTLIIVNTVKRAAEVYEALATRDRSARKCGRGATPVKEPDLRLIHSRFRGVDRRHWASEFLSRDARPDPAGPGRIVVSTQVVEAGVDISAKLLVTDLAPWPSLVQRFGRAARYANETGEIVVVGGVPDEKQARPYELPALKGAAEALDSLVESAADASPFALERFEDALSGPRLQALYPYTPLHILRRKDLDQLFDTTADLTGADVDISRFIRSGEDRDVLAFWRDVPADFESAQVPPPRQEEVCPVPIGEMKEWLTKRRRAFRFDYLEGAWRPIDASRVSPGIEVLIAADEGGYVPTGGWTPTSTERVEPVSLTSVALSERITDDRFERASKSEDEDALSIMEQWKTIAVHGKETGEHARAIGRAVKLESTLLELLDLAGRWHDSGKAHEVFQDAIKKEVRDKAGNPGGSRELAKAPDGAWQRPAYPKRNGFRHELVSTLALFEVLRRTDSEHPALLGPHVEVFAAIGEALEIVPAAERIDKHDPLAKEIAALDVDAFDLVAWLVCTHHGKVRCVWSSTPKDQESGEDRIHGVLRTDHLPEVVLTAGSGSAAKLARLELSLSLAELGLGTLYGSSWGERVGKLLARHGPFKLAYLEALLRAADVRASMQGGLDEGEDGR
jgi:CRISPR-associated endonuclease/helicase Cas3